MNLYLIPFLSAFVVSVVLIFGIKYLGNKFFVTEPKSRRETRHIHNRSVSRLGGIAIFISFLTVIFLDKNLVLTKDIWGILSGALLIFIMGVWDDFGEISWKKQIFFQVLAIALIFIFGVKIYSISNPLGGVIMLDNFWLIALGIFLASLWSVILMNSMNWLDGIDGLSMGIYLIGLVSIFVLSLKPEVNQPPVGIISMTLAGAVLGFLIFNFPPAKIMGGSSGIFFVGFVAASLSVFAGTKVATTLLVLFVPLVDFVWVIIKRTIGGKSIFSADKNHLHHKLLSIGWSQRKINIFFYSVTVVVAMVALNIGGGEKILAITCLIIAMLVFYWLISKKEKTQVI